MKRESIKIPVNHGNFQVAATIEGPGSGGDPEALIVMIPGSGPVNRDGNLKGMGGSIYQRLADSLVQSGFATLRYDKIGVGESTGDFHQAGLEEGVQCVLDIIDYCNTKENMAFKKIYLLGHSEGTIIATLAASRTMVDGVILLCGAGTALKTVITAQNEAMLSEIASKPGFSGALLRKVVPAEKQRQKQQRLFDKVLATNEATVKISGRVVQAKWLREHLALTDEEVMQRLSDLKCRVLAIYGSKDVQTPMEPYGQLNNLGLDHIQPVLIQEMNHMLKKQEEACSLLDLKKIYRKSADQPIHPELVEVITRWLQGS